ncbi:hypothetical protein QTJ16_002904 [Diplocarpon rosae]|uniref:Uncharacterized protein n=1 Tax=Diplocarpon rosae TaxID=946125 RepID=A0AAD9T3M6_9HELO|nr:hypothetical protein QTJ16_002904 [Diplocarpon rosae]
MCIHVCTQASPHHLCTFQSDGQMCDAVCLWPWDAHEEEVVEEDEEAEEATKTKEKE